MPHAGSKSPVQEGDLVAGKYRVERVIGIGGMGAVVAATHTALHQRVAIKVMLPAVLSSGESIERFLREARAVAKLRSPHVPRVLDVGTLDTGEPYMVMELLDGVDLARLLAESGPLPVADAVEYVRQACDALVEAHGLGVVHRDLKPENLFLARDGRGQAHIKVLDFGISKSLDKDQANLALTRTSAVMGSPLYMSPEQMRASRDVDARTDIWSLGVTLYQLVIGEVPFHAESAMALGAKVLHDAPVPPRQRRADVPPALDAIVLRCLEKDPSRRFPDAGALARALAEWNGASDGAPAAAWPEVSATTGPRVAFGAGGTPPAGSKTLPFNETVLAHDGPTRTRRATRFGAAALGLLAVTGLGAIGLMARTHAGASSRGEGSDTSVPTQETATQVTAEPPLVASTAPASSSAAAEASAPAAIAAASASTTRAAPSRPKAPGPRHEPSARPTALTSPSAAGAPPPATTAPAAVANPLDHL